MQKRKERVYRGLDTFEPRGLKRWRSQGRCRCPTTAHNDLAGSAKSARKTPALYRGPAAKPAGFPAGLFAGLGLGFLRLRRLGFLGRLPFSRSLGNRAEVHPFEDSLLGRIALALVQPVDTGVTAAALLLCGRDFSEQDFEFDEEA